MNKRKITDLGITLLIFILMLGKFAFRFFKFI